MCIRDRLNAWFFKMLGGAEKYLIMGFGYALGTEILGRNAIVICWGLFNIYNNPIAPAIYLAMISLFATIALMWPGKMIDIKP